MGDGFDDLLERHFRGERVAMVDDWFTFISIPAVQLHAATALVQSPVSERHVINLTPQITKRIKSEYIMCHLMMFIPDIWLGAAGTGDLVLGKVGVVR